MQEENYLSSESLSFDEAIKQKNYSFIKAYIAHSPSIINISDKEGITPFMQAIKIPDLKLIRLFMQSTDDPLMNFSHIDLAYHVKSFPKLRKYLYQKLENRYRKLKRELNSDRDLNLLVITASLSLFYYYEYENMTGPVDAAYKYIEYINKAEKLFKKLSKGGLEDTFLIQLHLKMGFISCIFEFYFDIINHYSFVINKQIELFQNKDYPDNLLEDLGNNIIIIMQAYLCHGQSLDKISENENKKSLRYYSKALKKANILSELISSKQLFLIQFYAGKACRYIGEKYQKTEQYRKSLNYYIKSIDTHTSIINLLAFNITDEHSPIIEELTNSYNRLYELYKNKHIDLDYFKEKLKPLPLIETKKNILNKKSVFSDQNLISRYYEAQRKVRSLFNDEIRNEKSNINTQLKFWNDSKNDNVLQAKSKNVSKLSK